MAFWHRAALLFVYGTLRQGECNHGLLRGRADWVREATCRGHLYSVEDHYPALSLDKAAPPVVGELYTPHPAARAALMIDLDRLEGIEEQYYRPVVLERPDGTWLVYAVGSGLESYCRPDRRIAGGDWCRYRAGRDRLGPNE
ncbi:gamma-glutamylcyclotransferase family protein [Gloeobacter violaceus]|nr:gamma-glutamylcyclotransferase family protein [Gloeobacter violaceus]